MSENAILPSHDSLSDHDLHWEMNYHEAAIFLEVSIRNTFPNNSNLSLRTAVLGFFMPIIICRHEVKYSVKYII